MELYGSLHNISGSVTASAFTGSFIGDGSGLTGIQASGVTGLNLSQISNGNATASISSTGFTVNKNTQIQGNLSVTGALIATEYIVSSSVTYMTTSFASGSSAFGNDNNDVHQFTGSVQITGSISLNGQAIGTGKLDETTFQSYTSSNNGKISSLETSSGSLNSFTSSINTTIKSKLDADNVISGSIQVVLTGTTGYNTLDNRVSSLESASGSIRSDFNSYTSSNDSTNTTQNIKLGFIETSTGSLNSFTSSINTTIKSKLDSDSVISGSVQVDITGTTGYSTFSSSLNSSIGSLSSSVATTTSNLSSSIGSLSSSIATTDLNQTNRLDSIEGKTGSYATTGSNLFKGTQTLSGSILPSVDNTYDLGSPDYQWRDVYISSGSLYIDGTKVLSSTTQELTITTDSGQSIKILESGTDSIILQTADGDIELKSNADGDILLDPTNGKILLKGTVEVLSGNKIQSSVGGTPIVFANDIVVSGSIDITGTIEGINLTDFSSSVNTRISNLESSSGSLNSFTSSANSRLNSLESTTGSLNSYTSSNNTRLSNIEGTTGSLNSYTSSNTTNINAIHTATSSLNSYTSSNNTRLGIIETSTGSINTFTSSANSRLSSIETTTGSIIGVNTTQNNRLDSLETTSGSILTTNTAQSGRLDSIEGKTGSYATTGSNIFIGNQTITGSLYVSQDLIIAGSSSIQHISSSVVNIADNIITVNAQNPSIRFGGIAVIDSGSSPTVSGSMLFDSVNNQWLFVHQNQGTVTSSVLLMGPETYNNIGNETYITANRLVKSTGIEHLTNSNISDDGTTVTILSNTIINGTFSATGTTIVSGSSQISHDSTTGYVANRHIDHTSVSISAGNGLSGGGDISATRTLTLDTASATFTSGVKSKMNTDGVISGSAQVVAALPSGTVSGSSQVLSGTGIWSGSAQLPSGVVSGSSQVLAGTTIHSGAFFNGISVVSGSGQISFNGITDKPTLVSGSSQISFNTISDKPTLVSGSSQITFGSISSIPGGLVSGSSQIDLTATTNYSTGIKTRLNAEGVVSGSSQISFGSISSIPSGLVSGSSQITLSSTTGYGSVLNQAVLTSSTPTFSGAILTNVLRGGIGAASTSGTLNWNDSTNARSGQGATLLTGNATNGPGPNEYFHPFSFEYSTWDGSGNMTQFAIPYNTNQTSMYFRGRYAGSWGSWYTMWNSGNLTNLNQLTNGPGYITGINSSAVTTALGYTPYNATNPNGYITGISFANVSSKPTTLSGYGITDALSNNADSEQDVGTRNLYYNDGVKRVFSDPRWNESGYDADLGTLHIYSTTAAGANYGRAGIALYNGSAYQYLTTKASTTGLFANNSLILTAGNISSYAVTSLTDTLSSVVSRGATTTSAITINKSGTLISHAGMSDAIGYNASYGTYIGSPLGGLTYYLYANGTFNENGSIRTLLHSGNFTSYAMSGAGYSANQNLNTNSNVTFNSVTGAITSSGSGDSNAPFRFGADYSGWMSIVAGAPGSNNGWGLFWAGNSGAQYGTNGASGPGDIWGNSGNPNEYVFVGNGLTAMSVYGNTGDVWIRGNTRVESNIGIGVNPALKFHVRGSGEMIRFENTSTGSNEYTQLNFRAGSRNGYIWLGNQNTSSWAGAGGLNIYTDNGNIDLWSNAVQRVRLQGDGHLVPYVNNTYDLGSASLGWRNVYTNDLHLSNMNKPEGNDVDGTNGNWTIQEGAENLYIINNNNGKKFKISLEEII